MLSLVQRIIWPQFLFRAKWIAACQGPLFHAIPYFIFSVILWSSLSSSLTLLILPTIFLTASALAYFLSWIMNEDTVRSKLTFGNGLHAKSPETLAGQPGPVNFTANEFSIPSAAPPSATKASTDNHPSISRMERGEL